MSFVKQVACALLFVAPALASDDSVVSIQLLDNGDFAEVIAEGEEGSQLVPWWRTEHGAEQVVKSRGSSWVGTVGAVRARQAIAAYAPLAGGVRISGRVRGDGVLRVIDGRGRELLVAIDGAELGGDEEGREFDLGLRELAESPTAELVPGVVLLGEREAFAEPVPRLMLELGSSSEEAAAYWTDLEVHVPLPCPGEEELRAEIVERLDAIFALWRERVIDPETGFACYMHDVVTGERLATMDGLLSPIYEVLFIATSAHDDPEWNAMLDLFLESWFAHCFHPETGMPRRWDVPSATPRDGKALEIRQVLNFLYDLADHGPERWRAEADRRLTQIGEHVLAHGAMPDGQVAAGYVPGTGEPVLGYSHLRRFDVTAPLTRLGAREGDERYRDLGREAVVEFEYTWMWPGTWEAIDPGFDDDYGHYSSRALVMSRAFPEEASFRRVLRGGYDFYAPLWRDALRLGGNVAADQVRCWSIFAGLAELEPELRNEVAELLRAARRVHFKGEQYQNGAWGDVTIFGFDPKAGLQVGDLPGMPQNILGGLASIYREELGLRDEETRAMFTAVMRSSEEHYKQPHGYLVTRALHKGANPGGGSLRFAAPLAEMLARLTE